LVVQGRLTRFLRSWGINWKPGHQTATLVSATNASKIRGSPSVTCGPKVSI
jgi:hypothetical protein